VILMENTLKEKDVQEVLSGDCTVRIMHRDLIVTFKEGMVTLEVMNNSLLSFKSIILIDKVFNKGRDRELWALADFLSKVKAVIRDYYFNKGYVSKVEAYSECIRLSTYAEAFSSLRSDIDRVCYNEGGMYDDNCAYNCSD